MQTSVITKSLAGLFALSACLSACASPAATTAAPTETAPTATATTAAPTAAPIETQSSAITLTDSLGNEITLSQPAQRIISLGASNTEILYAIGAGSQVVARDDFADYPEEVVDLPSMGGSMGDYDLEQITALKPDLVLAAEIVSQDQAQQIADLGLTVFYLNNPTDLDGMYENLKIVGRLTGQESEAEILAAGLQQRVATLVEKIAAAETTPLVFYEMDSSEPSKPYTSGPGSFIDQLITMAGGKNMGEALQSTWGQMSLEEILVANPDIIILGDANYGATVDAVKSREGWGDIKAVQNDQIYPIDDDLTSRPGPRMVDGLEQLAKIIHPELFPE